MANGDLPIINDFLARLYFIRDDAAARAKDETSSIINRSAARGLARSGATLNALTSLLEREFDAGLCEMLSVLRHMKSVPGIDYQACRDQAFLRARDLIVVLSITCHLENGGATIGRGGAATNIIQKRVEGLYDKFLYRMRQFDVGLDRVVAKKEDAMIPTAISRTLREDGVKPVLFPATSVGNVELSMAAPAQASNRPPRRFQVALSFAGEQRDYVREVANALDARRITVFYDEFESNTLWGKDGAEHFHRIFEQDTQYVVMFISTEYVTKSWTRLERRSAISQQMKHDAEYILPVRFDDTAVPGLPATLQYLVADDYSPLELAAEIAKKIGVSPTCGKASDLP